MCMLLTGCGTGKTATFRQDKVYAVRLDTTTWFDAVRNRVIPVALYIPETHEQIPHQGVVIFSHGYGQNKGGDYLAYSYLIRFLALHGYFVASIQHELATDSLMPVTGIPQIVRRPFWERGAANILYCLNTLKRLHPELDYTCVTLIGHSNGADMTALFAQQHPERVQKIVALDNRRMPLPRTSKPRVLSLRSSDQPADPGVLPTPEEQKKFRIRIVKLPATTHNEMDDHANEVQRKEINDLILAFLRL